MEHPYQEELEWLQGEWELEDNEKVLPFWALYSSENRTESKKVASNIREKDFTKSLDKLVNVIDRYNSTLTRPTTYFLQVKRNKMDGKGNVLPIKLGSYSPATAGARMQGSQQRSGGGYTDYDRQELQRLRDENQNLRDANLRHQLNNDFREREENLYAEMGKLQEQLSEKKAIQKIEREQKNRSVLDKILDSPTFQLSMIGQLEQNKVLNPELSKMASMMVVESSKAKAIAQPAQIGNPQPTPQAQETPTPQPSQPVTTIGKQQTEETTTEELEEVALSIEEELVLKAFHILKTECQRPEAAVEILAIAKGLKNKPAYGTQLDMIKIDYIQNNAEEYNQLITAING